MDQLKEEENIDIIVAWFNVSKFMSFSVHYFWCFLGASVFS